MPCSKRKFIKRKGVLKHLPSGHEYIDVARNLKQARSIIKAYPKGYNPKIVRTPQYEPAFPYHIACKKDRR